MPDPVPTQPAPVNPTPVSKPLSQIMVPGTKIPVDAAIAYAGSVATEILNSNVITNPHAQAILHGVALVLVAVGHALQTDTF